MPKKKSNNVSQETITTKNYDFVKAILDDPGTKASIDEFCDVFEADGAFVFRFTLVGKLGVIGLEFYSHGLAEWATDKAGRTLRTIIAAKTPGLSEAAENDLAQDSGVLAAAEMFAIIFIKGMRGKIMSLLGELERETECYVNGVLSRKIGVQIDDGVNELVKAIAKERKQFLRGSIERFGSPKWEKLQAHFDELLPKAKDAKHVFEKYKALDWRAMIKAGFPDFGEDQIEMLDKLSTDTSNLSLEAQAAREKEDYSLPANMALEQAARRCGMKPFKLGPRRIRDLMANGGAVKFPDKETSVKTPKKVKSDKRKSSLKKLDSLKIH